MFEYKGQERCKEYFYGGDREILSPMIKHFKLADIKILKISTKTTNSDLLPVGEDSALQEIAYEEVLITQALHLNIPEM